jgi:DNA-binding NtrC family response regulator
MNNDKRLEVIRMNQIAQNSNAEYKRDEFSPMSDFMRTYTLGLIKPQNQESPRNAPDALRSLEKTKESLVYAYLAANLHYKNIPLKEFTDDFEKNILLACLRLTHGSQRNAAALLGLKPTALFEKMRKHGINGKRIKLSEKLEAAQPREIA